MDARGDLLVVGGAVVGTDIGGLSRAGVGLAASCGCTDAAGISAAIGVARLASNCCSKRPFEAQSIAAGPFFVVMNALTEKLTRTYVESPNDRAKTLKFPEYEDPEEATAVISLKKFDLQLTQVRR